MTDLPTFLLDGATQVDEALDAWVPQANENDLAAAMRHILSSGGKRLRPNLVFLGSLEVGGDRKAAVGAAAAVEMVHAYSLLHDDLPSMDDGRLRRGEPCAHLVFGEALAVLAGDALLTLAFEVLVTHTPEDRPVARMVRVLAGAAGYSGMVGGQAEDVAGAGSAPEIEQVRRIHSGKTAALIAGSLQLGACAGGGSDDDIERLGALGHDLGLIFQITDDLLDLESTSEEMGKEAGADLCQDKVTWPAAVGVEQARQDATALAEEVVARAGESDAGLLLSTLAESLLTRTS